MTPNNDQVPDVFNQIPFYLVGKPVQWQTGRVTDPNGVVYVMFTLIAPKSAATGFLLPADCKRLEQQLASARIGIITPSAG